ncbi:MAG: ribosomal RNA small subunit methyltransferase A [Candidatus Coatesbacteria bacterium]|nr:MAG: ribosomal RNA small subunit methyltransferase A [Candidatus Coatesbacteria bacterium]
MPHIFRGQHILINKKTISRIIRNLKIEKTDRFIEIGSGTGNITRFLCRNAEFVIASELDYKKGIKMLRLNEIYDNLQPIIGDFLRLRLNGLEGGYRIFGNIPYSITSPIIIKILTEYPDYKDIHLTIQKDVAQRIASPPSNKAYSFLSALVGLNNHTNILFHIPPSCFRPKPEVQSSFIRITRREGEWRKIDQGFINFVQSIFRYKRKMLRNSLRLSLGEQNAGVVVRYLLEKGYSEKIRAEDLEPDIIYELFRLVSGTV